MVRVGEILNVLTGAPQLGSSWPGMSARADPLRGAFVSASASTGVPLPLLQGIAAVESGFAVDAVNPESGTVGLMQIHPVHFARLGWTAPTHVDAGKRRGAGGTGWIDPYRNVRAGAEIFAEGYRRERDLTRALARYNGASTFLSGAPQPAFLEYRDRVLGWANLFQW
jgi:soluble lytic murein transglycosylase-like protein